ncbi:MAG: helix-turn-helix domain-containing protein [Gammaproteobacteria bacterium]|nr:helix-turn-helix domain-containing protein [Gammaproteobacteria bacterium]
MNQDVDAKAMAKAFKALSNPNRLTIYLEILNRHEASEDKSCEGCLIADVMSEMNIGAPTVSHHVKELVNANLIEVERQGKYVNCYINNVMHEQLRHFFTLNKRLVAS